MLDLETLGTRPDAVVLSIGAVAFDEHGLGSTFYVTLDVDDQVENLGRRVQGNTVLWWGTQPRHVWNAAIESPRSAKIGLQLFSVWAKENAAESPLVWGNGADFDNAILGSLYDSIKMDKPWKYSGNRCYRTLKNLVKLKPGQGMPRDESTMHNALADAVHQANYAVWYLANLKEMQDAR